MHAVGGDEEAVRLREEGGTQGVIEFHSTDAVVEVTQMLQLTRPPDVEPAAQLPLEGHAVDSQRVAVVHRAAAIRGLQSNTLEEVVFSHSQSGQERPVDTFVESDAVRGPVGVVREALEDDGGDVSVAKALS